MSTFEPHLRDNDKVRCDKGEYKLSPNTQREAVDPEEGDDRCAVERGRLEVADGACDDHTDNESEHSTHVLCDGRSEDVDNELEGGSEEEGKYQGEAGVGQQLRLRARGWRTYDGYPYEKSETDKARRAPGCGVRSTCVRAKSARLARRSAGPVGHAGSHQAQSDHEEDRTGDERCEDLEREASARDLGGKAKLLTLRKTRGGVNERRTAIGPTTLAVPMTAPYASGHESFDPSAAKEQSPPSRVYWLLMKASALETNAKLEPTTFNTPLPR